MTEDNEARNQGAVEAIRSGLARLLDASQAGAAQIILDALAAEGYSVVKTEAHVCAGCESLCERLKAYILLIDALESKETMTPPEASQSVEGQR